MKKLTLVKATAPASVVNAALNRYSNVILFKDKYLKAAATIQRVGLPKQLPGPVETNSL
jgi:hypothetical protein